MTRTLLYDADCGFCARCVGWALALDCDVNAIPWQAFDRLADYGITAADASSTVHLIDHGQVVTGYVAIARTLSASRRPGIRTAGRVVNARAMRPVASRTYAAVAAHRRRLPGGTWRGHLP